ncbi:MAG: serine/threonine protein kinase, partial [Propionibacteriales bacterium]|nr:serine/threonine protein kinase [Propionibacteriales bacterium]
MPPDSIAGRYRVLRAVGRGGMGTVWLCTDEVLHRQVAVKQIGSLPGESPGDTARAMREARLAAALNHKNAVSIYDVVEDGGTTWLVMEYVPSQTLSALIRSAGRLPPARVAHIGAQVAAALSGAHSLGIVHRDVKPGNILVGEDDQAKLSDFGIARGHQDVHLTQTGMVTGTPAFFAPELARGDDPTFASDVWALGITLYTATEGAPPFEPQSNPLAMLNAITRDPLPLPRHAGLLTPVLAGMLQPDAGQRSTSHETLAALREVEQRLGATTYGRDPSTPGDVPDDLEQAPHQTSVIEDPVEPDYEKPVTVTAVSSSWSDDRYEQPPVPRDRRPLGRLAVAVLALIALLGAGALLWNMLGLGTTDRTDPTLTAASSNPTGATPSTTSDSASVQPSTSSTSSEPSTPATESDTAEPSTDPTHPSARTSPEDFT